MLTELQLTKLHFVFLGEFSVWVGRISGHITRGKQSRLTNIDHRELTTSLTSALTEFDCHFQNCLGLIWIVVGSQVDWV